MIKNSFWVYRSVYFLCLTRIIRTTDNSKNISSPLNFELTGLDRNLLIVS